VVNYIGVLEKPAEKAGCAIGPQFGLGKLAIAARTP
jgi:hypothetical protein